ncbi:MAG: F0F1 ATP synthase subunit epsilon [Actinobacteria bacterium]|nr:F0F1 ATP synthase subunit epsilon [Actinomycetota bacterium]
MKDKKIFFEVITPEQTVVSETDVDYVVVRRIEKAEEKIELGSELGIYPFHSPMLVRVPVDAVRYKKNNEIFFLVVGGGFLEVKDNKVVMVCAAAEQVEEVDIEVAKAAKIKADKWLEELAGRAEFNARAAEAELKRAMVNFYKSSSHETE